MTTSIEVPRPKQDSELWEYPMIVSTCYGRYHPQTQMMLDELRFVHGWNYTAVFGSRGVDRVRCQAASKALQSPNEWQFWCDDDNWLPVDVVVALWEEAKAFDADVLSAVVPTRRMPATVPNYKPLPGEPLVLGGGVVEARESGVAMAFVHRRVFERLAQTLPRVEYTERIPGGLNQLQGWPFFWPIVEPREDYARTGLHHHHGEDYSFARRVRAADMRLLVDTNAVACHAYDDGVLTPADLENSLEQAKLAHAASEVVYD